MPPSEPPSEVVVRVKVPPGHIQSTNVDEFSLGTLSTSLSVTALRQRIQTLVPSHPQPHHQRILYGGRALTEDGQSLADALNTRRDPSQTEYVVHLLIRDGAEHGRSGSNTPQPPQMEHRPLQPQPIQATAFNQFGALPWPQQMNAAGLPGMARTPSRPGSNASQQDQPAAQSTTAGQPAQAAPRPHHHHHHHHHPHMHHHGPNAQHGHALPRPISGQDVHVQGIGPNGERFAIHQHTVNLPLHGQAGGVQMPGMPSQGGPPPMPDFRHIAHGQFPGLALPFPLPGMAQQQQAPGQPPVASALDRARQNMSEMRRMVEELRTQNASEESRRRITELEQRMQAINDYIDPFRLSSTTQQGLNARPRSAGNAAQPPQRAMPAQPQPHFHFGMPFANMHALAGHAPVVRPPMQASSPSAPVTAYLLSSPSGPQALVFTPDHGVFTGSHAPSTAQATASPTSSAPTGALQPTPTVQPEAHDQQAQQIVQAQPEAPMQQQLQQPDDPFALIQPFLGHLWLLLRIMIFAYFLLGTNFGWRRPLALALIGLGFWMIRIGLLGNGGLIRRWWDDIIRIDDVRGRILRGRLRRMGVDADAVLGQAQNGNAQPQAADVQQPQAVGDQAVPPQQRPFPTPGELAERLVRERQNDPLRRLREQLRPIERVFALFVASLWPGVGERYVQALDQAREEEEATRRALEAAQQQAQQASQQADQQKKTDGPANDSQENKAETQAGASNGAVSDRVEGADPSIQSGTSTVNASEAAVPASSID